MQPIVFNVKASLLVSGIIDDMAIVSGISDGMGILADKFSDLYKAAKKSVETDPKWADYRTDKAKAIEFGKVQQALANCRDEGTLNQIWEEFKPTTSLDQLNVPGEATKPEEKETADPEADEKSVDIEEVKGIE